MADIVRRDPFQLGDFAGLRRMMDRMFNDSFARLPFDGVDEDEASTLPVDISETDGKISETDGKLMVRASVPGVSKDDIDVQVHEGVLSITAKRDEQHEEKGERYYRRERHWGAVSRRIALPGVIHDAEVDAELKDGVLTLTIPTPEQARPKQIEIKSAS